MTTQDREYLLECGSYSESDFRQIEQAMRGRNTAYAHGLKRISRKEAMELLGRERYLSGISRSAFHWTAAVPVKDGDPSKGVVYFDSRRLFKEE